MAFDEPAAKRARNAVVTFIKLIVTAALSAVATWRLGLLLGLPLGDVEELLALGLPLALFFFAGVFGLVIVAWVVGPFTALVLKNFGLKDQLATVVAAVVVVLAIARWTLTLAATTGAPLPGVLYVIVMIGLCAVFWRLSKTLRLYWTALVVWELGVAALALAQFAADDYLPNSDFIILGFVVGSVPFLLLFAPKTLIDVGYPEQRLSNRQWLSLIAIHGAGLAFFVPSLAFATSLGIGYARAAVHVSELPLVGIWLIGAVVLAFVGWLVGRGWIGCSSAIALVAILWLASAYYAA